MVVAKVAVERQLPIPIIISSNPVSVNNSDEFLETINPTLNIGRKSIKRIWSIRSVYLGSKSCEMTSVDSD